MDAKTPRIALLTVGKVAQRISGLDLAGQEEILDGIHKEQPIAIAYVAALAKHGVPYETIDHVAHVVMVIFECFRQTVGPLPQISEDAIIHEYDRMQTMLRFFVSVLRSTPPGACLVWCWPSRRSTRRRHNWRGRATAGRSVSPAGLESLDFQDSG